MTTAAYLPSGDVYSAGAGCGKLGHDLGELKVVPLTDLPPSPVVIAWKGDDPLTRAFVEAAARTYRT